MKKIPQRPRRARYYRTIFTIVAEGSLTEYSYIRAVQRRLQEQYGTNCVISPSKPRNSSVKELIQAANKKVSDLRKNDQVWILVDRDPESHTEEDMHNLMLWEQSSARHHVALSNPRFEYWLLRHFEDAPTEKNALDDFYVARYLPGYDKYKDVERSAKITYRAIESAICHAGNSPYPTCEQPNIIGSGMHLLVRELINAVGASISSKRAE